jgi:2EXR family
MTGFLDLPGEIRNRIYTLAFPEQQVLLRSSHPKRDPESKSTVKRGHDKRSCQLYASAPHRLSPPHCQLFLSAHLLRVCHKIHEEALPLLYSSTALHFESMKAINLFLNGASHQGLQHTKKLAITQSGYGEPYRTSDECWKIRHDQRWMSTCKKIAEAMTSLQHLRLGLQLCDWPTQLNLNAKWARPLFYLKGADGLDRVDLYLCSSDFSEQRLAAASRMLEKAMMSERGRAQRQLEYDLQTISLLEEAVSKEAPQVKAKKVLTIKIPETQKSVVETKQQQQTGKKKNKV